MLDEIEEIMDEEETLDSISSIADKIWEYIWAEVCIATTKISIVSLSSTTVMVSSIGNCAEETKDRIIHTGILDGIWGKILDNLNDRFMNHNMSQMSSERIPVPHRALKLISKGHAYCG